MNDPTTLRLDSVNAVSGRFDDIIDVRAPSEFSEDHLPGSINLPVLNDAERAQVGTIYKQVSPFDARKVGAALVAANVARHIAGQLTDRAGGWRPLVYCWRGGQRSGAMATILSQVGWRVARVEGGYKLWRNLVVRRVQEQGFPSPVLVLDGNTGSAKTAILNRLAARGHQVIDLEGLANHRGSLFGAMGDQPSQKMFEGRLASAMEALDPSRPVLLEAESSRIGQLSLPRAVWHGIAQARRLTLEVPLEARAAYSASDYADIAQDKDRLHEIIRKLAPLHAADRIEAWHKLAEARDWKNLAEDLMRAHYDPRYAKHRARYAAQEAGRVGLSDLRDLEKAADKVETAIMSLPKGS